MTSPAVVGSAWVVLRATSDKVRDDIKKAMQGAWKDNEKEALAAGRRAGQRYGRGFRAGLESQKIGEALSDIFDQAERAAGLSGSRAGKRFAENYNREIERNATAGPNGDSRSAASSGNNGASRFNLADIDRANRERDRQEQQRSLQQQALRRSIDQANAQRDQAAARQAAQRAAINQRFARQVDRANESRDAGRERTRNEQIFKVRTVLDDTATKVLRASLSAIMGLLRGVATLSAAATAALAGQAALAGLTSILGTLTQMSGVLLTLPALMVAFAAPIATAVIGAQGLGNAFKAMKAQTEGAATNAKAVAAAQDQVTSAEQRLESAHEGVERAEKSAESAARAHKRARDGVAKAIEDVTERLQDMNLELKGTALDEEDALIAVARAEENLRNLGSDATALDRREAVNDLKKAQLQLEKTRESNEDTRQSAAKMYAEGVEGSEEVRDARQAEADAADAVVEAQRGIRDANREVAASQKALADAIKGVDEAAKSGGVDEFNKAMAKLAPSARDFVLQMQSLGPEWSELRKAVQQNLFSGLGDDVSNLARLQMPILKTQLSETANILNKMAKEVISAFASPDALEKWQIVLTRVNAALQTARPGVMALVSGFKNLVTVGSEFLGRFANGFVENAQQFENWTKNFDHIRSLIDRGITAAQQFWDVLKNVGSSFMAIMNAGAEANFMAGLVRVTGEMNTFLHSVEGQDALKQFFDNGSKAMTAVAPVLKQIVLLVLDIGSKLANLGAAIAPGVTEFLQGFREGVERLQPALDVLGPKISALFSALGSAMPQLGDTVSSLLIHFSPWLDILTILSETLLPVFLKLLEWLAPALSAMAPLIVGLAIAWKALGAAMQLQALWAQRAAAATFLQAAAARAASVATKIWTGIQAAFNLVMSANPIALIVLAIAGLVAAFVVAYKNSETFRNFVNGAWESIKKTVVSAWENWIKPAWEDIATAAVWLWDNVLKPIFNYIVEGWKLAASIFMWAWENVIKPAWDFWTTAVSFYWENVIKPVFNYIVEGWKFAADIFMWAWENVISPAWTLFTAGLSFYWENLIKPVFNYIVDGWKFAADIFSWAWENIIKPVWNAFVDALKWAWENRIEPMFNALKAGLEGVGNFFKWVWENVIKPAWDGLGDGISWVWENIIKKVFNGIQTALDVLKNYFENVVKGIGVIWDGLKEIMKAPLKFVVDTVYNNGIRKAWNTVAGIIGADEAPELKVEGLASGGVAGGKKKLVDATGMPFQDQTYGVMSGYSPGKDDRLIAVGGGESVLRPEATRAVGAQWVNGVNSAARSGGTAGVKRFMREAYEDGGIVESMRRFVASNMGPSMQLTSGLRFTDNGYHSKGQAADFSDGSDTTPGMQRLANLIANTFGPPKTLQLIHQPFNRNIGQGVGFVGDGLGFYGAGTMSEHRNHVHWAVSSPVDDVQGDDKSVFGSIVDGIAGLGKKGLAAMFDAAVFPVEQALNGLSKLFNGNESPYAQMPMGLFKKAKTALREYIVSKDGDASNNLGAGAYYPSPGTGPVQDQVREAMIPYGWNTGPEWDALVQLVQGESSWNPLARNPSSGAFGLFQFLGTTKDQYLPDENPNPRIQGAAGARYIKDRYGSPTSAWAFWNAQSPHWYDNGGWLKRGLTLVNNETDGPEAVLTGQQWDWVKNGLDFNGANKWLSEQDYGSQFQTIGIDALKETLGGFTDLVGLKSVSDDLIDQAVTAAKTEVAKWQSQQTTTQVIEAPNKIADTMIFNGMDADKVIEEQERAAAQAMTPSNGRYRGAN